MSRAVVFLSGKGGTGKTTTVACVGSYLVRAGLSVICIDADPLGGLDIALGATAPLYDLVDAVNNLCPLRYTLVDVRASERALDEGVFRYARLGDGLTEAEFESVAGSLKQCCDWLLIDAPAGLDTAYPADLVIYVVNADVMNYRAASAIRQAAGRRDSLLIVNRVRRKALRRYNTTLDDAIDGVGAMLLGYVPEDFNVALATMKGTPLAFYNKQSGESSGQKAYKMIVKRLLDKYGHNAESHSETIDIDE